MGLSFVGVEGKLAEDNKMAIARLLPLSPCQPKLFSLDGETTREDFRENWNSARKSSRLRLVCRIEWNWIEFDIRHRIYICIPGYVYSRFKVMIPKNTVFINGLYIYNHKLMIFFLNSLN